MTPEECFTTVTSLLPTLPSAREFTTSITFISRSNDIPASPPPPPPPTSLTRASTLPHLHIVCRESNSDSNTFTRVAVDGLGASGALSGRGYFEPAMSDGSGVGSSSSSSSTSGGSVHVLSDRVSSREELIGLLTHEFVHAVDSSVHRLDLSTCAALACSEIRAAAASECSLLITSTTATSSKYWPNWYRAMCVRNVAKTSTAMVFPQNGGACVDALFSPCSSLSPSESPVPTVAHALRTESDAIEMAQRRNDTRLS
jgi:hypothetical protein